MTKRVIVVGAGPTGLVLACELRLAGIGCRVVEQRAEEPNLTRAFARARADAGAARRPRHGRRARRQGHRVQQAGINGGVSIDLSLIESRYAMMLIAPQSLHRAHARATLHRRSAWSSCAADVVGFDQDADGVTVTVSTARRPGSNGPTTWSAATARTAWCAASSGVDFVGKQYPTPITARRRRAARAAGGRGGRGRQQARGLPDRAVRRRVPPRDLGTARTTTSRSTPHWPPRSSAARCGGSPAPTTGCCGRAGSRGSSASSARRRTTGWAGFPGRRRRARPLAGRRSGHEHRHPRRDEPGLEARLGDARPRGELAARHASSRSATRSGRTCSG